MKMGNYERYIPMLKELAKELNQSHDDFHLGGEVENLIIELGGELNVCV